MQTHLFCSYSGIVPLLIDHALQCHSWTLSMSRDGLVLPSTIHPGCGKERVQLLTRDLMVQFATWAANEKAGGMS